MFKVLADNAYSVGIVHGLVEKVTEELYDVRMILSFEKLYCFFLQELVSKVNYFYLIFVKFV